GVADRAGAQAVAEREAHVIFAHQVANLVEALVQEALLVMRQAPLGHDRAAARNNAGDAVGGEVDVAEPHAGVDGEVIDALLALLDQRVLVALPVELDGIAVDSSSAWLMFEGMMARPRATSLRTNSGVTNGGTDAPKLSPSASAASARSSF